MPSAAGLGALLLCAAIRTRGIAGPFALAAVLMLIWMVAMVVVRGADGSPVLATLLDPSGYAEVEEQANLWTPREKAVGVLQMTTPLVVNRLLWTFPPLLLLGVVLRRVQRERLALERAPAARGSGRAADEKGAERSEFPMRRRSASRGGRRGSAPRGARRPGTSRSRSAVGQRRSRSSC